MICCKKCIGRYSQLEKYLIAKIPLVWVPGSLASVCGQSWQCNKSMIIWFSSTQWNHCEYAFKSLTTRIVTLKNKNPNFVTLRSKLSLLWAMLGVKLWNVGSVSIRCWAEQKVGWLGTIHNTGWEELAQSTISGMSQVTILPAHCTLHNSHCTLHIKFLWTPMLDCLLHTFHCSVQSVRQDKGRSPLTYHWTRGSKLHYCTSVK